MARMLQALKNLEARSIRPQATQPSTATTAMAPPEDAGELSSASEQVEGRQAEAPSVAVAEQAVAVVDRLASAADEPVRADAALEQEVSRSIDFAAAELAKLTIAVSDPIWPGSRPEQPELSVSALGAVVEDALRGPPSAAQEAGERVQGSGSRVQGEEDRIQEAGSRRQGSGGSGTGDSGTRESGTRDGSARTAALERVAIRTLSDPIRSRPLVDLADRLHGDIRQTASKTLLLVGVGSSSGAPETLLYAGMLLAERRHGEVLLVDADLGRRTFSRSMERSDERGFGEMVFQGGAASEFCHPTASSHLHFLPAGQGTESDLSTAGTRLEAALQQLAERFAVVLIDGGRTGELAAATLARETDATYLVVQLGLVEAAAAQAALRDFRASGARILGCIAT